MSRKHDVLIIGMGLAAMATAARLKELGYEKIALYATGYGGTPYIAAVNFVLPDNPYGDTTDCYNDDMIHVGYGVGNRELVKEMTSRTAEGYELLCRWGIEFAHNPDGTLKRRHLSGHTYPRTLCCTTRLIGEEMLEKLSANLLKAGVELNQGWECLKLLEQDGRVYGAMFRNPDGEIQNVYAPVTVAAWGGVGQMFTTSTYPGDIRGNTLSIAHQAGAKLIDLEFLEYEPMVVASPAGAVGEPCPTAMLGEGAYLLNSEGERFLLKVRPQGEGGAPKTLINREIWKQVDAGKGSPNGGIWVDLRHIDREVLKAYPWFFNRLMENGVDPNRDLVEVAPMAHSISGGVKVDENYRSNLEGFYAVGEACGGVHGACRSGGNAASQATMSGYLCAEGIQKTASDCPEKEFPLEYPQNVEIYEKYVPAAQKITARAMGIYRRGETLAAARDALLEMMSTGDLRLDEGALQAVDSMLLMVRSAYRRQESRGTHMRLDYPEQDPNLDFGLEI